jgi:outer membrane protein assembly factor BamD (BamD/ComL family)
MSECLLKSRRFRQSLLIVLSGLCMIGMAACSRSESHLFGRAEGAQRVGSYDQAVLLYESYLQRYPNGEFAEKGLYNLGNIYYLNLRNPGKAQATYEDFLKKYPSSQYAFTVGDRLAELYERDIQDYRKAIDVLEQISRHTPSRDDWRRIRYKIATDYFHLDQFDQAIIEFKKLIQDQPEEHRSDEARIKLAAIYEIRKQWHDAVVQLQDIIDHSNCEECRRHAQLEIVDCYVSQERPDLAIAALKKINPRPEDRDFVAQRLAELENRRNDRRTPHEVNWLRKSPPKRKASSASHRQPAVPAPNK